MTQQITSRIIIIFFLLSLIMPIALAGEGTAGDYMKEMGTQFGRGLENIVTSPAEIPCTMRDDMDVKGGSGFFTGFGKGLAFMGRRILVGVSEILTFVMPRNEASLPPVCKKAEAGVS